MVHHCLIRSASCLFVFESALAKGGPKRSHRLGEFELVMFEEVFVVLVLDARRLMTYHCSELCQKALAYNNHHYANVGHHHYVSVQLPLGVFHTG